MYNFLNALLLETMFIQWLYATETASDINVGQFEDWDYMRFKFINRLKFLVCD